MSSNAITTIATMLESLPDNLQERVVEQLRTYIADLSEEEKWAASFQQTQSSLVAAARQAKREIADGKSVPMDYDQL
jgi:translation initiation factor 2B subunit (eIF-2B alpha/beta/delta family)